jgi:hypothetical protein
VLNDLFDFCTRWEVGNKAVKNNFLEVGAGLTLEAWIVFSTAHFPAFLLVVRVWYRRDDCAPVTAATADTSHSTSTSTFPFEKERCS